MRLREIYQDRKETIDQLLGKCRDLYLLTDVKLRGTSLAHNLLAPVVIKEYSVSVKPGQQSDRILKSKIEEFRADTKGIWLNDADLEIVEKGKEGMRRLDADEERLLRISREHKAQRERERKRNRIIRNVLGAPSSCLPSLPRGSGGSRCETTSNPRPINWRSLQRMLSGQITQ